MLNLVTVTDSHYLAKALTLYESLKKTQKSDFNLSIVCLDEKTNQIVQEINEPTITALPVSLLEEDNFEIKAARFTNPSREAISNAESQNKDPRYVQFCWALASYSCWYILHRQKKDHVFYLDADLFFYEDMTEILEEINDKSIGIVRHRIDYLPDSGEFNVGLVYFKNDYHGRRCSDWWKRMLLNPNNPFYAGYGHCGDQKYLELFPLIFGSDNVCIIDDKIGHLAPWSATFHKYKEESIIWEDREQKLFFFHFAHFVPDFASKSYKTSYKGEWIWGDPEKYDTRLRDLYDEYFQETVLTLDKYEELKNVS